MNKAVSSSPFSLVKKKKKKKKTLTSLAKERILQEGKDTVPS